MGDQQCHLHASRHPLLRRPRAPASWLGLRQVVPSQDRPLQGQCLARPPHCSASPADTTLTVGWGAAGCRPPAPAAQGGRPSGAAGPPPPPWPSASALPCVSAPPALWLQSLKKVDTGSVREGPEVLGRGLQQQGVLAPSLQSQSLAGNPGWQGVEGAAQAICSP